MNLKTIVVVNDFNYVQGGASKVAIDTAQCLHEKGYNVIFFSGTYKENEKTYKQISTQQRECLSDGIKGAIRSIRNIKVEKEFSKLLDSLDNKSTIIHIHGWTKSLSSVVFKIANKKNFKIVLTVHDYFTACPNGGFFNYKKRTICKYTPLSPRCMLCNCDSRNYFFKLYRTIRQKYQNSIIKKTKMHCIYISDFSKNILKDSWIAKNDSKRINNPVDITKQKFKDSSANEYYAFLGRISKEKGVDIFCKAITECGLKGIVIGDGSELNSLKRKYPEIEFTGWKNTNEIQEILKKVRILVFTSLWYETMGLTVLEAKANGIPAIVGNTTAASEYIINGRNGFVFKTGDVEDLKIKLSLCDDKTVSLLSKTSYDMYWKKPFDKENYVKELINYYLKILKE